MSGRNTYFVCFCAALAQLLAVATSARAQETDGQVMIGAGIAPISVMFTTSKLELSPEQRSTFVRSGLAGQVQLAAGFGLGPCVLAIETAFIYSAAHESTEDVDFAVEETTVTKRTDFLIGPSARLLFIEGAVRPFVEAGAGIGFVDNDRPGPNSDATMLYVRGGPGMQVRLADSVSLDLTLRAGYSTTSGELDYRTPPVGQSEGNPDSQGGAPDFGLDEGLEYNVRQISVDLAARLSIWL